MSESNFGPELPSRARVLVLSAALALVACNEQVIIGRERPEPTVEVSGEVDAGTTYDAALPSTADANEGDGVDSDDMMVGETDDDEEDDQASSGDEPDSADANEND